MKLDRLETHDRYKHFTKQNFDIGECCQDLINQRPFGNHNFYIFVHARTHEDGVRQRLIWQPRLTKPTAQTNSALYKAYVGTDLIKTIWDIPIREKWPEYEPGKVCADAFIMNSIFDFQYDRGKLEDKEDDDLSDAEICSIYLSISREANRQKMIKGSTPSI